MRNIEALRPPHIALYGQCGFGNFGNDATLEVVLASLRRALPGARFTAVVREPATVAASLDVPAITFYPPPHFPPRNEHGLLRALRRAANDVVRTVAAARFLRTADYLILAGGGRFDDFNSTPMAQPYWKWKWVMLARFWRVPVEFVAIGAGPVDFGLSKWFYARVARAATRRSFRDEESRDYVARALGVDTSGDEVVADLVFAFPARGQIPGPASPVATVGVGVMEYNNRRGAKGGADDAYPLYVDKLTALCLGLLERGRRIRILIGETCDMSTANDLHARLAAQAPDRMADVALDAAANMHDVFDQIGRTDAVIATRFHNVLAALALGRPTLSIGYASKNDRLMEDFGLGAYCQSLETLDVERALVQFDELAANAQAHGARIRARATELRRMMDDCLERLAARISSAAFLPAPAGATPVRRPRGAAINT
jgi:polysaccharide pyruvyl transferase WcaK-like protein